MQMYRRIYNVMRCEKSKKPSPLRSEGFLSEKSNTDIKSAALKDSAEGVIIKKIFSTLARRKKINKEWIVVFLKEFGHLIE